MDSFDTECRICGLVLFENYYDETFSVEKVMRFYKNHRDLDDAVMCVLASLVSEFVSDVGSSAVFFPIVWHQATQLGCDPMPFVMSLMLSVTISFASPIGSSTHMLIYGPGSFRFTDFARIGIIMHIVLLAMLLFVVNILYPLH